MSIHRFNFTGQLSLPDVIPQIPVGVTAVIVEVGLTQVDIDLSNDSGLTDLTGYIEYLGGSFAESAPTSPLAKVVQAVQAPVIAYQTDPPGSPNDGDRYLVLTSGSGAWTGHDEEVAQWRGYSSEWMFLTPTVGYMAFDLGVGALRIFDGAAWTSTGLP